MSHTTILVVEDNRDHSELIRAVFATGLSDAKVRLAFSGEQARSYLIDEGSPTLITLDLSLPDSDGLQILEWLRSEPRFSDIPVIVFTTSSDPVHVSRAYELGARRYMLKPANFGKLVDAAKDVLGGWIEPDMTGGRADGRDLDTGGSRSG